MRPKLGLKKKRSHLTNGLMRLFLIAVAVVFLYPLFWNVYSSFKTNVEFLGDPFALPSSVQWSNYARALEKTNIGGNFKNSLYVVLLSLVLIVILVVPCSYCLARFRFLGQGLMRNLYMALIFIQAPCIMIPLFMQLSELGWLNKLTPLSLLYAVGQIPFSVFLLSPGSLPPLHLTLLPLCYFLSALQIRSLLFLLFLFLSSLFLSLASRVLFYLGY